MKSSPRWRPELNAILLAASLLASLNACDSRRDPATETSALQDQPLAPAPALGAAVAVPLAPLATAPAPPKNERPKPVRQDRTAPRATEVTNPPETFASQDPAPASTAPSVDKPEPEASPAEAPAEPTPPANIREVETDANRDPAKAKPPEPPNPCATQESRDDVPVIDDTRQLLEERTCSAALWLDGLFAEKGDISAAKRTRGFLEIANVYSQFGGFNSRTRLHIEYDLPTMQNRLSAFIGRENDEDFVRGRVENAELRSTFPALGSDNKWLLGLGYSLPSTKRLQTQFRVGVRGLGPPTAFTQGRLRYTLYADDDDVSYVRSTPFWNTRDGFGITNSFDYSHVLSRKHLLRWFSVGTISERTVGLNWRNSLMLYQNLEKKRGLSYEVFIRGETDNPEPLYEYGSRVLLRHPLLDERLFLEWSTGYSFPRTDPEKEREGSYNVGLSIELPYGQVDDEYRR